MDITKTLEFHTHTDEEWIRIMDNTIAEMSVSRPNGTKVVVTNDERIIQAYINQN